MRDQDRLVINPQLSLAGFEQYIHLKEVSVDFIKRRPAFDLDLVFKVDAGAQYKSNRFKEGDLVHWNLDLYVRTHTSVALIIRRAAYGTSVAEILVKFEPNEFSDDSVVRLEDSKHRVTVNFVCERSKSLADVTHVLGSQTRTTALASKVPRALKLPKSATESSQVRRVSGPSSLRVHLAPQSSTSECPGYDVLYAAVHLLNDDILLDIFNCYRLDEENGWNDRLGWCKISHVCQRWRLLIYKSTFHLGMHIHCTYGTPAVDTLDHLPPLPLLIDYKLPITGQDGIGIYHALRLPDRVRQIDLNLPPSILHKCLVLMDEHFPILEHLSLSFADDKSTTLTLPKAFRAPNLRHLDLPGISPSKRLRMLSSTTSLVTLVLWNIQTSSYFRPKLLVARLRSLPQLKELSIGFSIPIPRPSAERELLGEHGTPATLPNLKTFRFKGVSVYLECLVAQISAPLLEQLSIKLFNQIAFALPHLSHLINITERFKLPAARVYFRHDAVFISTAPHSSPWSDGPFRLYVMCNQLDWQIDCATQICSALTLTSVEQFTLDIYHKTMPSEFQDGGIDCTIWHELLNSFIGVKELYVCGRLLEELSQALQVDEIGLHPGFLPDLQNIVAADNLFASFIDTRQVVGRPVRFSPLPQQPPEGPELIEPLIEPEDKM